MVKTTDSDQTTRALNAYEEKHEARGRRYEERVENAAKLSESRCRVTRAEVEHISPGCRL